MDQQQIEFRFPLLLHWAVRANDDTSFSTSSSRSITALPVLEEK
jgi:hypothetical protein